MVAPRAAPPAGAFVSGQAVFHGRELLAELPLVSYLLPSLRAWLQGAVRTGPATPLGLDPSPCPWIPAPVRNAVESSVLRLRPEAGCFFLWQLPSPRPLAGFGRGGGGRE